MLAGLEQWSGLLGIVVFLGVAYLLSENRKAINPKVIVWGLGLQILFAVLVLGIPSWGIPGVLRFFFDWANGIFLQIMAFSDKGAEFVFGHLVDPAKAGGFIFAFKVLPSIIFFSTLVAILYHLKVLQKVVYVLALIMKKFIGASGPESLSTAANIFLGQTEAPLLIKPYIAKMTRSELLCVMIGGMANVAGGVMAAYVALLHGRFPDIAGHLLTVSVMSAPASILIAKIMLPETQKVSTSLEMDTGYKDANILEAATRGAGEGLSLALNVAAMLLAFTALMALINAGLGWGSSLLGADLSLQKIFGFIFAPIAFLMGTPVQDLETVGRLLGEKVVLNEFVAYLNMSQLASEMSDRAVLISSYALCGFANFASIGIQVGGIGSMAPERRGDLGRLGFRALIGGNLATFICAAIVSLLL